MEADAELRSQIMDQSSSIVVLALEQAIPTTFPWGARGESSRESAEAIVRLMETPGDGPDEERNRRFAALAKNVLAKRAERRREFPRPPASVASPALRPASVLDGSEGTIRKMLVWGHTPQKIAD